MRESELKAALREIFDNKDGVYVSLMSHVSLPRILNIACEHAFMRNLTTPATDILRKAVNTLEHTGKFEFEDEQ